MAQTNPFVPGWVFHDGRFSVGPIMLNFSRIVATFVLVVAIAEGWPSFGTMNKILAILLFLHVLVVPSAIRLREKRSGRQVDKSVIAEMAYLWIMMLAMVFTRVR